MKRQSLFPIEEDEHLPIESDNERCTPEDLLAFIQQCQATTGNMPTLRECKERYGGILGAMCEFWKLRDRGLV